MELKKIAVLDDYDQSISKLACWKKLDSFFLITFFDRKVMPYELSDFHIIVANRERTILDSHFLSSLTKLEHVALTGRLSGQADLEFLKQRNITVSYTDGSGSSAAEQTMALLLGITKRIHLGHTQIKNGGWQQGLNHTLHGKTLGVLGLGRVGTKVAQFGKVLDMNVISWGPTPDNGRSLKLGIERVALDECLSRSDVLCLCLRLSDETRELLKERELKILKDGSFVINAARAEIIEKKSLYSELSSGRIFGAFDVFHNEPLAADDPIRFFDNVLLSPHMGYVTEEVYDVFFNQVVTNILKLSPH